jgi:hypothetical protein
VGGYGASSCPRAGKVARGIKESSLPERIERGLRRAKGLVGAVTRSDGEAIEILLESKRGI